MKKEMIKLRPWFRDRKTVVINPVSQNGLHFPARKVLVVMKVGARLMFLALGKIDDIDR